MKAILFDLDGTLVDSVPLWITANLEALKKREEHVRSSIERAEQAKQEAERILEDSAPVPDCGAVFRFVDEAMRKVVADGWVASPRLESTEDQQHEAAIAASVDAAIERGRKDVGL